MSGAPITFTWTDEGVMRPLPYFDKIADRRFVVGENYRLDVVQQRSSASHAHFFACVKEAFDNLPESQTGRWRSPEHLRKWALCQTEFCDSASFIAKTKAEAMRLAGFLGQLDEYSVILVDGCMVERRTAKSQSYSSMSKADFQRSKDAVLDVLSNLIGVEPAELTRNAGQAA